MVFLLPSAISTIVLITKEKETQSYFGVTKWWSTNQKTHRFQSLTSKQCQCSSKRLHPSMKWYSRCCKHTKLISSAPTPVHTTKLVFKWHQKSSRWSHPQMIPSAIHKTLFTTMNISRSNTNQLKTSQISSLASQIIPKGTSFSQKAKFHQNKRHQTMSSDKETDWVREWCLSQQKI